MSPSITSAPTTYLAPNELTDWMQELVCPGQPEKARRAYEYFWRHPDEKTRIETMEHFQQVFILARLKGETK